MSSLDAVAILLAALVATSGVEILKDLTPLRYVFNRWAVQRWLWLGLDLHIRRGPQLLAIVRDAWLNEKDIFHLRAKNANSCATLEQRVVELAACGRRSALYRPEVAQIAAQLNLLAERLMDFPAQDELVLRAIAGVSLERPEGGRNEADDDLKALALLKDGFRAALAKADAGTARPLADEEGPGSTSAESGILIDRRTRVTALVQGRLNELQVAGRMFWRVVLLLLAIGIAALVLTLSERGTLLDGVFAGVLAPIGYEALSVLKRLGRG